MAIEPKWERGGRGLFCKNMDELVAAASITGLSDKEIGERVGAAQSTVKHWRSAKCGDRKYVHRLLQLIQDIESGKKSIYQNEEANTGKKGEKMTQAYKLVDILKEEPIHSVPKIPFELLNTFGHCRDFPTSVNYVLENFKQKMQLAGDENPLLNKEELIEIFQVAANLLNASMFNSMTDSLREITKKLGEQY